MFSVNQNPIVADELEILKELRRQLLLRGIIRFDTFRPTNDNIMTNCPFHKGGQERKPSFGINKNTGQCHCFTCGWAGPLDTMISNLFGYDDEGDKGREWLSTNFLTLAVEDRRPINLNLSRGRSEPKCETIVGFTEEELDSYRWVHPYMYERKLNDDIIGRFDIGYDNATNCITFPVYNRDGSPAFIARRSVKTKFFNYPEGVEKPVYAAERFVLGNYRYAVICESILNALTCWKWGIPAMALIGTGTPFQYEILKGLPVRKYILALDPDEAGNLGRQKLRKALQRSKIITEYEIPTGYDLNDLDEEILNLVEIF